MIKVHITSMGCAKNLVDSEVLAGQLRLRSYKIADRPEDADLIFVNTCGFIETAKEESIQAILEAVRIKNNSKGKKVFVNGCLSQRYKEEIRQDIPEVDAVFGTEDYENILSELGEKYFQAEEMYKMRSLTTPRHYAYLKISEGCNHTCSFCAIPGIRGKHKSRKIESILEEAEILAKKGVKELLIVSQDTSYYGWDLYGKSRIIDLLRELAEAGLFTWIRPLYWYPSNFPMEYISLINRHDSLVPYLDMPVQHASDKVLRLMRRAETNISLRSMYKNIRDLRPDIALRTTIILGHPGESEDDFIILKDFLEEIRFDRLGTFVYSDEENTQAFDLSDKVDPEIAVKRREQIMDLQQVISLEKNEKLNGEQLMVMIDEFNAGSGFYTARTNRDAPEIDNEVLIRSSEGDTGLLGTLQPVKIYDSSEFELYADFCVPNMENKR